MRRGRRRRGATLPLPPTSRWRRPDGEAVAEDVRGAAAPSCAQVTVPRLPPAQRLQLCAAPSALHPPRLNRPQPPRCSAGSPRLPCRCATASSRCSVELRSFPFYRSNLMLSSNYCGVRYVARSLLLPVGRGVRTCGTILILHLCTRTRKGHTIYTVLEFCSTRLMSA